MKAEGCVRRFRLCSSSWLTLSYSPSSSAFSPFASPALLAVPALDVHFRFLPLRVQEDVLGLAVLDHSPSSM